MPGRPCIYERETGVSQRAKLVFPARRNKTELAGDQQLAGTGSSNDAAAIVHVAILGLWMAVQRGEVSLRAGTMEKGHVGQPERNRP